MQPAKATGSPTHDGRGQGRYLEFLRHHFGGASAANAGDDFLCLNPDPRRVDVLCPVRALMHLTLPASDAQYEADPGRFQVKPKPSSRIMYVRCTFS